MTMWFLEQTKCFIIDVLLLGMCTYGVFHETMEVGISEFKVGNFKGNAPLSRISDMESLEKRTTPTL